jgi:hypothetical protein
VQAYTYGSNLRIVAVTRYLFALILVFACASPASAWSGKARDKAKQTHVGSAYESQQTSPKPKMKFERDENGELSDPYWEPCAYTTDWNPNGRGGS